MSLLPHPHPHSPQQGASHTPPGGQHPSPAEQAYAQLLQQVQIQQAQIAALSQQAAVAAAAAAQPPPAPAHLGRRMGPSGLKLPTPAPYAGSPTGLDDFVAEMRRQFAYYDFAPKDQVPGIAAFLTGPASDWWTSLSPAAAAGVTDVASFVAALKARFQPVTTADSARATLHSLKQNQLTVNAYIATFRKLMLHLPAMEEGDRIFSFTAGLKPSIAMQLRVHQAQIQTVDQAIEMAARVGSVGEFGALAVAKQGNAGSGSTPMELDALGLDDIEGLEKESTASGASSSSSSSGAGSAPITRDQFQLLLAAMQDRRESRQRPGKERPKFDDGRYRHADLSRAEMDAHFAARTCFECGKTGHRAHACPKKKAAPSQSK
jgi:hypothetical protein